VYTSRHHVDCERKADGVDCVNEEFGLFVGILTLQKLTKRESKLEGCVARYQDNSHVKLIIDT
jgi:hypothetical protein